MSYSGVSLPYIWLPTHLGYAKSLGSSLFCAKHLPYDRKLEPNFWSWDNTIIELLIELAPLDEEPKPYIATKKKDQFSNTHNKVEYSSLGLIPTLNTIA